MSPKHPRVKPCSLKPPPRGTVIAVLLLTLINSVFVLPNPALDKAKLSTSSSTEASSSSIELLKTTLIANGSYNSSRHDSNFLLRFLKSNKMDIENTKSHIIRYEDWRVNADVDGIVADFSYPELGQVMETIDRFYYKTDLEGRPVYYERLANFNFEKLLKATTLDRFTKFWIREQEKLVDFRLPACSRAANHHVGQVFSILDLKGVGAGTFGDVKKLITHMAAIASQNYPETLYKLLIINTPWQFSAIWPLASAFMDPRTAAKVTILGKNYQKDVLLFISRENVPIDYGGSSEEEIHSDIGPWSSSLPENARWNFSARDL